MFLIRLIADATERGWGVSCCLSDVEHAEGLIHESIHRAKPGNQLPLDKYTTDKGIRQIAFVCF